ncbi:MAG: serine/threonine-protein kinase, partial [Hyphomicrobiales bacterium]
HQFGVPFARTDAGGYLECHRGLNAADVIDERYRLERLLGTGGMSEVWLAEDERLGRWVAVKLLRESAVEGQDIDLVASLEREARVVARLQHPNIASVFDVGRHDGRHYLVMEYVHGQSLREILEERGRLTEQEVVRYGIQIASALQYAHDQGVIHCDVKPENILVTEQGIAKAVDFGVAETVTRTLTADQARDVLGTIAYLAPEVIQGSAAGVRSDVYSLGLTLYEMEAGRLPFAGNTPAAIAGQRLAAPAPPLRAFARDASPEMEQTLARALALSPADRFVSAEDFAAALRRVPVQAAASRPVTRPVAAAPVPPVRRRHPTSRIQRTEYRAGPPPSDGLSGAAVTAIVIAVLLALGLGVTAAILFSRDDNNGGGTPSPSPSLSVTETLSPTQAATQPPPTATPTTRPTDTPTPSPARATATPTPTRTPTPPAATATAGQPTPSVTTTSGGGGNGPTPATER